MRSLQLTLLFLSRKWQPAIFCPALVKRTGFILLSVFGLSQMAQAQNYSFGVASLGNINTLIPATTNFRSAPVLVDLGTPGGVFVADGKLDLVVGSSDGTFRYYVNNGTTAVPNFVLQTGGLSPLAGLDVGTTNNNDFSTPHFADLDADGDLDLLSGDFNGQFHYYENHRIDLSDPGSQTGTNSFEELLLEDNPLYFDMFLDSRLIYDVGAYSTIGAIDVDADCDLDIITGNSNGGFFLFENFGDQNIPYFPNRTNVLNPAANPPLHMPGAPGPLGTPPNTNSTVGVVDLNCDGIYDFMSGSRTGVFYFRRLNQSILNATFTSSSPTATGNPFFQTPTTPLDLTTSTSDYSYPTFGDLDGDGDMDAISGSINGRLYYIRNNTCNTKPTLSFTSGGCGTTYTVTLTSSPQNLTATNIGSPTAASACAAPANTATVDYAFSGSSGCAASPNTEITCDNIGAAPVALTVRARNTVTGVKSADCIVYVNVTDNVAPAVTPPIPTTPPTPAGTFCSATPYYIDLDANGMAVMGVVDPNSVPNDFVDICPITLSIADQPPAQFQFNCSSVTAPPFLPPNNVPYQIILRATDNAGNSGTCIANVVIRDVTAPSVMPSSLNTENLSICTTPAVPAAFTTPTFTVTDNCATTVTGTVSVAPLIGFTGGTGANDPLPTTYSFNTAGTYTLTYTFTDGTNTTTLTQTIIVANSPLAFSTPCPGNQVINLSTNTPPPGCTAVATWTPAQGVDCATGTNVTTMGTHTSGSSFPLGTTTVVYTAISGSNNIQCYFTITVVDDVDPVATWPATTPYSLPLPAGTFSNAVLTSFNLPANSCNLVVNWTAPTATVTDNCPGSSVYTIEASHRPPLGVWAPVTGYGPGSSFGVGEWSFVYYYEDAAGNASNAFEVWFSIIDNTPPTITCPSPINTVTAPGVCYADIYLPKPTLVGDNCTLPLNAVSGPVYGPPSQNFPPGSDYWRFEIGTTTPVTFTVTDASGLSTSCTMTVTVRDAEKPTFTSPCPTDLTLNAGSSCTIAQTLTHPTVMDNSLNCTTPGTLTYTLIITTPNGATATIPISVGSAPGFALTPATSAITFNEGITMMKYLIVDGAGNKDSCQFKVYVRNTVPPQFTRCPSFQGSIGTFNSSPGICGLILRDTSFAFTLGANGGGPGCDPGTFAFTNLVTNTLIPSGTTLPPGTHILRVVATDYSGNTASCQFRVTIVDNQAPATTSTLCSSTINVNTDAGLCTTVPTWGAPTFTDNCAVVSTILTYIRTAPLPVTVSAPYASTPLAPGTYVMTYTARDAANLPGFCVFTVVVRDNQAPDFANCPTTTQLVDVNGPVACSATYTLTLNVTDNCALSSSATTVPVSMTVDLNTGTGTPSTLTSTFMATDAAGNTRTCSITVQARDVSGPVIPAGQCPANQVLTIGSPSVCTLPHPTGWADPSIGAMTDCTGPISMVSGPTATSATLNPIPVTGTASLRNAMFPVGINTIRYVFSDAASPANTSTCTFTVEVREGVPPVITNCPSPITVDAPATACSQTLTNAFMLALPAAQRPTATDLCSPSLTYSTNLPTLGTVVNVGSCATVVWTVTDASSNTATCSQSVCVRDATPPVVTCGAPYTATVLPGNTNVENNNNTYPTLLNAGFTPALPTFTDNCSTIIPPAIIGRLPGQPGQYPVGTHALYWVVTDANGNTASCSQQITILGNTTCTPSLASAIYSANQTVNLSDLTGITFTPAGCCTTPAFSSVSLVAGPAGAGPYPVTVGTPSAYTFTVAGTYTLQYTISCTPKGSNPLTEGSVMTFQRTVVVNPATCTPTNPSFSSGSNCGSTTPVSVHNGACPATVTITAAQLGLSATDNCGNVLTVADRTVNATVNGNQTITFTATVGITTASCTRTISVTCSACTPTSPTITCNAPTTINVTLTGTNCSAPASSVNWGTVTMGDNCTSGSVTGLTGMVGTVTLSTNAPASFGQNTTTIVTFTATNTLGTAQCQKTVVVAPNTACSATPTMTLNCPAAVTVSEGDDVSAFPNVLTPSNVTTSCTGTVVISSDLNALFPTGFFEPADIYTVTWTASVSGCTTASCTQQITVESTLGISCPWTDQNKEQVAANVSLGIDAAATGDRFGSAVETEGDWAIAGAPWEDDGAANNNRGAAYILRRNAGNNFDIVKKLIIPGGGATNDYFGESVSIDVVGGVPTVVVGARGRTSATGAAYVFSQNQNGPNAWGLVTTLSAGSATGDAFGTAVAIDGDIIAVGAPGEDEGSTTESGALYIFRNIAGTWTLDNTVREVTPFRANTDNLGGSVAVEMNGTTGYVLAGARQPVAGAGKLGFVLAIPRTGAATWGTQVKLTAGDGTSGDQFGTRVAMDGMTAVIGAALDAPSGMESGSAYVFDVSSGIWTQTQKLTASIGASGDQFGFSVDIDGNNIIVGARYAATGGLTREGAAYLFKRSAGSWSELVRNDPSDGSSYDLYGSAVSISGCTAMVGAPTHTTTDLGAVYVYDCGCANPQARPAQALEERNKPQAEILDLTNGFAARCFPNPVQETLNIELQLSEETETTIVIADATGRVATQLFNGTAAPGALFIWDTSDHPAGLYFVRITAGANRKVVPVSVIR